MTVADPRSWAGRPEHNTTVYRVTLSNPACAVTQADRSSRCGACGAFGLYLSGSLSEDTRLQPATAAFGR
jgi:hypothetical protein